ncbi:MAG: hypothetical protein AB3N64_12505 [Puniceicoccaceae bacterium]
MDEIRQKVVLRRFYISFAVVELVLYLLLMAFVLPWWHASNHPVVLSLGAGSAQNVQLAYAVDEEPLPLVPLGDPEGYQWKWGTELPPRPSYELALVFPDGTVGDVVLKDLNVTCLTEGAETYSMDLSLLDELDETGVRVNKISTGYRVQAEPGGAVPVSVYLPTTSPFEWLAIWFKATFGFVVVGFILFFSLATFVRFPDGVHAYRKKAPFHEVLVFLVCAIIGAVAHLHLVRHAMPAFSPGESEGYLLQAIGTSSDGSDLPSQGHRPGYPTFLAQVGEWTSWDLTNHTIVQAIFFCLALLILGLSLVRLIQGYFLGPIVLLAMVSPPVIFASRHIGVESVAASCWMLSMAAFLLYWQRDGFLRWLGIILFSLFAFWTAAITPTGLMLYMLPIGLVSGTVWWTVKVRGSEFWGMSVLWRAASQAVIPFVVLFGGSLYLSSLEADNPAVCSLPGPSAVAPFTSGMFEVRALVGSPAYGKIINERASNDYSFDGPAMKEFSGLAEASMDELPLRAKLVAWGRLTGWGLFLPDVNTYGQEPLNSDYRVWTRFRTERQAQEVRTELVKIMRATGTVVQVMEKRSNKQLVTYNQTIVPVYKWFYRVLLFAALVGWMIGLSERKYLAAVLVFPFLLKVLMHILTMDVTSESVQVLDACLWLGALAGLLCLNPKAQQKATDESDRRCMPPIRPKKLMTRHKDVPGTQGLPTD